MGPGASIYPVSLSLSFRPNRSIGWKAGTNQHRTGDDSASSRSAPKPEPNRCCHAVVPGCSAQQEETDPPRGFSAAALQRKPPLTRRTDHLRSPLPHSLMGEIFDAHIQTLTTLRPSTL